MWRKKVKLYLQIIDSRVVSFDIVESNTCNVVCEVSSMDDFFQKTKQYEELDEELENEIRETIENDEEKKSVKSYKIKHWVSNRSFGELIDMYTNGEIRKPDMQREFVWDSQKSSRLIESIILGLPIPPLFLLEVSDNEYELIDGYQRITIVTNYVNENPWNGKVEGKRSITAKLSENISEEIRGKSFGELDPEYQRMIKRSTIPLIEFKQIDPDNLSSKYLIFERINTG